MTVKEFSDGFDTLINVQAGFGEVQAGFDEYEKSVFLTKAQENIVIELYNSFENTEEIRRYLSELIAEDKALKPITTSNGTPLGISSTSTFFTLPENLMFITMESVTVDKGRCGKSQIKVYPVKQDEYQVIKDNPFRGANEKRALRLDLSDGVVEIVCKYNIENYYIRYVKKPSPIILVDLPDGLTIDKESKKTECKLHESLHKKILEMAVRLAIQSKSYGAAPKTQQQQ